MQILDRNNPTEIMPKIRTCIISVGPYVSVRIITNLSRRSTGIPCGLVISVPLDKIITRFINQVINKSRCNLVDKYGFMLGIEVSCRLAEYSGK